MSAVILGSRLIFVTAILWLAVACAEQPSSVPVFGYRIVASFPHDPHAFTQGLISVDGQLIEGTGNYGRSSLRRVDPATGRVEQDARLPPHLFGEGVTLWQDRLIQLTWREGLGLIHDRDSLALVDTFEYSGEGWGLTHDGRHWIMSDGSSELRFLDPDTRRVVRRLPVRDGVRAIDSLNELEWVEGEIWANVWHSDRIARIDPATGGVTGWIDLSGLYPEAERPHREAVLNGVAYDAKTRRLFVTGKNWPRLYEIEITPSDWR